MGTESAFLRLLLKIWDAILLGILFLIGCLPVVTVLNSGAALYRSLAGTLEDTTAHPFRDFATAYKRAGWTGVFLGAVGELMLVLLLFNCYYVKVTQGSFATFFTAVYTAMFLMVLSLMLTAMPMFSRFDLPLRRTCFWLVYLWGRHFLTSILMLALFLAAGIAVTYAPVTLLVLPEIYMSLAVLFYERLLNLYRENDGQGREDLEDRQRK